MRKPILLGVAPILLGVALTLLACATSQPSSALPEPNAKGEYTPAWPEFGQGVERYVTVQLGPDTYAYCRGVTPKFPFAGATTYVQYADQLQALASCLNHDVMLSRRVILVGHADPRGTEAYNMGLGERRAQSVKELLIAHGLDADRIDIRSEGERGAMGQRPDVSFPSDEARRVDIIVIGGVHKP